MGLLVDGQWQDTWYDTDKSAGRFVRQDASFRQTINAQATNVAGRFHLYVSHACPWAHRALLFRQLKGLTEHIGVTVVSPIMLDHGWAFNGQHGEADPHYQSDYLHQLYTKAQPDFSGRVTVPVLWDTHQHTIINNESSEIIRIFNEAFNSLTGNALDFYPAQLRKEIDAINSWVYNAINNGVYKSGFATQQHAYEEAFEALFKALDKAESILNTQRFLTGDFITEADWRLFTTLIRFDAVYVGHFKCNQQRIADYPALSHYLRSLYQVEGVAETVNMTHVKQHYYVSHPMINPTQIVPAGPTIDFMAPHNRGQWQLDDVVMKAN